MARPHRLTPHNLLWCDSRTRVVICKPHAVPLTILEFALLQALRGKKKSDGTHRPETLTSSQIVDLIYHNAKQVENPISCLHWTKRGLNKKLKAIKLQVVTPIRKGKALWRLEPC
jgi:hypothetical protein